MRVQDTMSSPARTCRGDDTLEQAARLMWEFDCGCLPVIDDDGRVRAMITDRDICMTTLLQGRRLTEAHVSDCMSKTVVTCQTDDDLAKAARRMMEHMVRRLPVTDREGRVKGVLSLNDLARAAGDDRAVAAQALAVLNAVCQPRALVPWTEGVPQTMTP